MSEIHFIDGESAYQEVGKALKYFNRFNSKNWTKYVDEKELNKDKLMNPMDLVRRFNKISVQAGHVIDWVHSGRDFGGNAVYYRRKETAPPFTSYEELNEKTSDLTTPYQQALYFLPSPEGYFQFAILNFLFSQFYLYWHALYGEYFLLLKNEDIFLNKKHWSDMYVQGQHSIADLIHTYSDMHKKNHENDIESDLSRYISRNSISPKVYLSGHTGTVIFHIFSIHSGINTYEVKISLPNTIISMGIKDNVAEYFCGEKY